MIVLISQLTLGGNGGNFHQYDQNEVNQVAAFGTGGTMEINVIYQGQDLNARVAIDENGHPKTAQADQAVMPCPPVCAR